MYLCSLSYLGWTTNNWMAVLTTIMKHWMEGCMLFYMAGNWLYHVSPSLCNCRSTQWGSLIGKDGIEQKQWYLFHLTYHCDTYQIPKSFYTSCKSCAIRSCSSRLDILRHTGVYPCCHTAQLGSLLQRFTRPIGCVKWPVIKLIWWNRPKALAARIMSTKKKPTG
jgi:hypothetical protein